MELKLDKKVFSLDNGARRGEYCVAGVWLRLSGETKTSYTFDNVSPADVEMIQLVFGKGYHEDVVGVTVKSRYVRKFVGLSNPDWRG